MSLKSKLKQRKPDFEELVFCLDRPLAKRFEAARAELARLNEGKGAYGGKAAGHKDAADLVKSLQQEVAAATVKIRISSMDREAYNSLVLEHPPREGINEVLNPETFYLAAAKATAVEVTAKSTVPIPDEDWAEFEGGLTDGEHDRIANAVIVVNRNVGSIDFDPFA